MTFIAEEEQVNIKQILESILRDLLEIVRVIREKIEDQLHKICL